VEWKLQYAQAAKKTLETTKQTVTREAGVVLCTANTSKDGDGVDSSAKLPRRVKVGNGVTVTNIVGDVMIASSLSSTKDSAMPATCGGWCCTY
jgi:hypothetical protein